MEERSPRRFKHADPLTRRLRRQRSDIRIREKYEAIAPEPSGSCIRMGWEIGICESERIDLMKSDLEKP